MISTRRGSDRQCAGRGEVDIVADIRLGDSMIVNHDHLGTQRCEQSRLSRIGIRVQVLPIVGVDQNCPRGSSRQRTTVSDKGLDVIVECQDIDRSTDPNRANCTTTCETVVAHVLGRGNLDVSAGSDRHRACQTGMSLGRSVRFGQVAHNRIARTGTIECRTGRGGRGSDQVRVAS